MLTRLKNWLQGSRRRSAERWASHHGNLSEQEKHVVEVYEHTPEAHDYSEIDPEFGPKAFDEERRGRPN
jgi:hypothetical protein